MALAAGLLRHKVLIEEFIEYKNSAGEREQTWITFKETWASVEPLSAREFIAAQQMQSKVTARITMRYTPGINAAMRIVYRGQIFNIEGILSDKISGLEYLTMPCSTGTNAG